MKNIILALALLCLYTTLDAQVLDDIVPRKIMKERRVLAYQPLREADIFWEKRVWRVLDVREKMNQPFLYPQAPFFQIIVAAAEAGELNLYRTDDDKFTYQLDNLEGVLYKTDTIETMDPVDYTTTIEVIRDDIFYEDIKRFRIKEVWFFDENTANMQVRILGIAPLIEVTDDRDNFLYEKPLFWVYYPQLREVLAREQVFNIGNDASLVSWEDLFERRQFASTIYKSSNVLDARLQDMYSGIDQLLEADKIKQEIFNFEHDLWSY